MIAQTFVTIVFGIAGIVAGAALLEDRAASSILRSLVIGGTIGLWLVLWYATISLAFANAEMLSEFFSETQAPQWVTFASAILSWIATVLTVRLLRSLRTNRTRRAVTPGILVSLAWASVLIAPLMMSPGNDAPAAPLGLLALTVALAALAVPVSRV